MYTAVDRKGKPNIHSDSMDDLRVWMLTGTFGGSAVVELT